MYEHLIHYCHKIVLRYCPLLHDLLRHCPLLQCPPLRFTPSLSTSAMSTPVFYLLRHCPLLQCPPPFFIYSVNVHSCIFSPPQINNVQACTYTCTCTPQFADAWEYFILTAFHTLSTIAFSIPANPFHLLVTYRTDSTDSLSI